jgi:hypothetical protein
MCSECSVLSICQDTSMQRTVTRFHLHDAAGQRAAELAYWLAQPVQARIAAVEALRELQHRHDYPGQAYADLRMQRVCSVRPLKSTGAQPPPIGCDNEVR